MTLFSVIWLFKFKISQINQFQKFENTEWTDTAKLSWTNNEQELIDFFIQTKANKFYSFLELKDEKNETRQPTWKWLNTFLYSIFSTSIKQNFKS